jgi:hypothetical protein
LDDTEGGNNSNSSKLSNTSHSLQLASQAKHALPTSRHAAPSRENKYMCCVPATAAYMAANTDVLQPVVQPLYGTSHVLIR